MQPVSTGTGTALCRYCGEQVPTNRLSTHIASKHPRPAKVDETPTLVKRPSPAVPPTPRPRGKR